MYPIIMLSDDKRSSWRAGLTNELIDGPGDGD
jgi:hypothetical protein